MIVPPWENVAEICVQKPMAVVVQDLLPSQYYTVEKGVGSDFWGAESS